MYKSIGDLGTHLTFFFFLIKVADNDSSQSLPEKKCLGLLCKAPLSWINLWLIRSSSVSLSVMSDSLQFHGLFHGLQSARLLHPWNSPGKDTGVGGHFLSLSEDGISY